MTLVAVVVLAVGIVVLVSTSVVLIALQVVFVVAMGVAPATVVAFVLLLLMV